MKQLRITAPSLHSDFGSLFNEAVQPLQIKLAAVRRPKVIEMDDEESALSRPATAASVKACLEDHGLLVYGSQAVQPSSVDSFSAKSKKTLV